MNRKSYSYDSFLYGVVYYPEQWPEARWDSDLARIAQTGMNVVRMGEGAWSVWEPEEGRYDFALFDRALELCLRHGLKAIMGTPTYTPPAWLTERYPEVSRVSFDGTRLTHGSRRHYNYTSPIYRQKSQAITEALAEHYQGHPAVIGWQIDNELNCHLDVSFAPSDHEAFRAWCQERYGTLDALNQAWGTAFWSQTYTAWDQVWLPRPTVTYQNPSLLLDFYRFTSDMTIRFGAMQRQIIKRIAPHQFVTHNAFQTMTSVDLPKFVQEAVDFVSYDSYPEFKVCDLTLPTRFRDRSESKLLSRMRGVSPKFMVLEQQSGPSGQIGGVLNGNPDYLHPTPKPGQMRLWCWNSIANGADGLLFFRWRSLPYGSEAHWNGLLYHDERNTWRLEEAKRLGDEIKRVSADADEHPLRFDRGDFVRFRQRIARPDRAGHWQAPGSQRAERVPSLVRATFVRRHAAPVERSGGRRLGQLPNRLFPARARADGRRRADFAGLRGRGRHAGFRLLERLPGSQPLVLRRGRQSLLRELGWRASGRFYGGDTRRDLHHSLRQFRHFA